VSWQAGQRIVAEPSGATGQRTSPDDAELAIAMTAALLRLAPARGLESAAEQPTREPL